MTEQNEFIYVIDNPKLKKIRGVFCFGCLTGARFIRHKNLSFGDIKDGSWYLRTK
jgi:hypothetical protein